MAEWPIRPYRRNSFTRTDSIVISSFRPPTETSQDPARVLIQNPQAGGSSDPSGQRGKPDQLFAIPRQIRRGECAAGYLLVKRAETDASPITPMLIGVRMNRSLP
jgi:hypothetical protein